MQRIHISPAIGNLPAGPAVRLRANGQREQFRRGNPGGGSPRCGGDNRRAHMSRPRILILTADIGAGHDLPARLLAEALAARAPDAEISVVDGIEAMGRFVQQVGRRGSEFVLERLPWLYDLEYWFIARFRPTRWLGSAILFMIGRRGLERLIEATDPDVIVSTYPGTTEALGRLKRAGRLDRPCVSAITDLAALGLLGAPRHRPSPDHPRGVARGGPRHRGHGHRDPARARALAAGLRRPARARRGAGGARAAGGGARGRGLRRRLGGRRPRASRADRPRDRRRDRGVPVRQQRRAPRATACRVRRGTAGPAGGRSPSAWSSGSRPPMCSCTPRQG